MTQIPPRGTPEFEEYKKHVEEAFKSGFKVQVQDFLGVAPEKPWEDIEDPVWFWEGCLYRIAPNQPQSLQNQAPEPSMTPTEQRIVKALDLVAFALGDVYAFAQSTSDGRIFPVDRILNRVRNANSFITALVGDLPLPSPSEAPASPTAPAVEAGRGGSEDYVWDEVSQQFFKRGEHPIKDRRDAVSAFKSHGLASKPVPLQTQVGGEHYQNFPIQPVEFITANKLSFLEGCVVKRICRHRNKNGIEDLRKAIHEIELLIELEYGKEQG